MTDETDRINSLERLPRRRSPGRDLWPDIAARLQPRRRSRYPQVQLALAASLVAGLAAVFTFTLSRAPLPTLQATGVGLAPQQALARDSRAIVQANLSLVQQAQRQLRDAIQRSPDSSGLRELLANTEHRERDLRALL